MNKKLLILISLSVFFFLFINYNTKAVDYISPTNSIYKEGIYKLNPTTTSKYELSYEILEGSSNSSVIVLDKYNNIIHQNRNCNAKTKCVVGTINNENTIVILGSSGVALFFN